jgi:hypothetical protein
MNTRRRFRLIFYFARAGSVEDFCLGVWPVLLPKRLEADELMLVLGERNDVVLVQSKSEPHTEQEII